MWEASYRHYSSYMPRSLTPAAQIILTHFLMNILFVLISDTFKPSSSLHLYPSYGAQLYLRACECPCGLHDSLCTLKLFCSIYPHWLCSNVLESSNTRYWWVATPFPDKDFHLASNAKLSWRTNDRD